MVIQSPPGWGWDRLRLAAHEIGAAKPEEYWHEGAASDAAPAVRRIGLAELREHKAELIAFLIPPVPAAALPHPEPHDLAERAALVEYGAGVPRAWAEGFAAVASMFKSWMRATASRKVFITTNDNMVFHAEGLSVEEIARLLSIAKNTIAFDKSKTGESTPRLPCDSE